MRLTITLFSGALAFAISGAAHCLTSSDVSTLSNNFGKLISSYGEALANRTLTAGFQDYSESVNTLMDSGSTSPKDLSGVTFSSRAAFETASAAQPSEPFSIQSTLNTCDTIVIRWLSAQSPQPVYGISILHTVWTNVKSNPSNFQIDEVWAEFDSASWLVNLGCTISGCPAPSTSKREVSFES